VAITYNGSDNAPTNAGSYEVIGTVTDANHIGGTTNTLIVSPANATVALNNLAQTYDGTARVVTADTTPAALTVAITYNGSDNAPTNAGSYEVIGTVTDANYVGGMTNTLVVGKVALTVKAEDKSKMFGEADPEWTANLEGFVAGESEVMLGGALLLSREPGEAAGDYAITASGLSSGNYDITYEGGTLTITAVSPVILSLVREESGSVEIVWSAISNVTYRVQYQEVLGGEWFDLVPDVVATNGIASKVDQPGVAPQRFYQVLIPQP
jgi:hypothetical protein